MPRGYTLLLKSRTCLSLKGITTVGGVIDSDYRGPIKVLLHNSTSTSKLFKIKKGQRISQGIFLKHIDVTFEVNNDENFWNYNTYYGFGRTDCQTPEGISHYDVSQACEEERMNDPAKQTKARNQEDERS